MAMQAVAAATPVACKSVFWHWKLPQLLTLLRVFLNVSALLLWPECSERVPSKLRGQNHSILQISSHWHARPAPRSNCWRSDAEVALLPRRRTAECPLQSHGWVLRRKALLCQHCEAPPCSRLLAVSQSKQGC